jgi:hypothetical protein
MVSRLSQKPPAPGSPRVVRACLLPLTAGSSLGWTFVYGGLLSLLGWGLLLRMLLLPREVCCCRG